MKNQLVSSNHKHSLFKESISVSWSRNKNGTYNKDEAHTLYTLYVGSLFETASGLHKVFNTLNKAGRNDKLKFVINSGGGLVNEGKQLYNIIQNKFYDRTIGVLDNRGYSMGALLFSMCDKRIVYKHSELMYHNYSGGAFGKGGEITTKVDFTDKVIIAFFKEIVEDKGFLSKKEFKKMLVGQDYWFDTKEMCKRGIATHVIIDGKEIEAKQYLKMLKKGK